MSNDENTFIRLLQISVTFSYSNKTEKVNLRNKISPLVAIKSFYKSKPMTLYLKETGLDKILI